MKQIRIGTRTRRVDPFHMPTELADGLGPESAPRNVINDPLVESAASIRPCKPRVRDEMSRFSETCGVRGNLRAVATYAGFSAPLMAESA